MKAAGETPSVALPAPLRLSDTGLSLEFVAGLLLKTLHFGGDLPGTDLARRLGLSFLALEPVIEFAKAQQFVSMSGGHLGASSFVYRITDAGRTRARVALEHSHYVGPAPVPLEQYRAYVEAFSAVPRRKVSQADVRSALAHLVVSARVRDQLGPAVNAGQSMFIYGPPGNGKTVISQAIQQLLPGEIHVPHALAIDDSIVRVFDAVHHEPIDRDAGGGLDLGAGADRRWVLCRRPLVMVGGELTLDQLELNFNAALRIHSAPIQALANGGVLVIDDFGRQRCSPQDLLNRWIVPLESRVDYLTLQSGHSFQFPFMTMIVFATNLRPRDLVDEAFLRRVPYKIRTEPPTRDEYLRIFEDVCRDRGLAFPGPTIEWLFDDYYRSRRIEPRACQPRDLTEQALALADYLEEPRALTRPLLEAACDAYFVDDAILPPVRP